MCEVCLKSRCPRECPNYSHKIIGKCAKCQDSIYDTDMRYSDDDGNLFCDEICAIVFYRIRKVDD